MDKAKVQERVSDKKVDTSVTKTSSTKLSEKFNLGEITKKMFEDIENIGLTFNKNREIVDTAKKQKYKYTSRKEFEVVQRKVAKYLQAEIEGNFKLEKMILPVTYNEYTPKSFVNISSNFSKANDLLIIFPDRLNTYPLIVSNVTLFYENVTKGTIIPILEKATEKNYSILIMNPNVTKDYKKNKPIVEFNSYDSHCEYVWKNLISYKHFKNINIITFGMGSIGLLKLMNKFSNDFLKIVNHISLINSPHNSLFNILTNDLKLEFEKKATNYALSEQEAGSLLYKNLESGIGCKVKSCGTTNEGLAHFEVLNDIFKDY